MATVKTLPYKTKSHLYNLITDTAYRGRASSASYDLGGPGSPGKPIKKFGWEQGLAAGTEQRNSGRDPGRYRLGAFAKGGSLFWYMMTHVGANSYKFELITGFPVCSKCRGTGEHLCADCNGTGRIIDGNFSQSCTKCKNTKSLKNGIVICECGGKHIANGSCVTDEKKEWGV